MADLTPKRCPRKTSISTPTTKYKVAREHGLTGKINQIISVLVKGGIIELIGVWNEDGTDDGFDPALKNTVRENGTFAKKAGLFKLAERRAPPGYTMHEYMPSPQSKKKQNGDPFPRHWYMRLVNSNSPSDETTVEVRKQIAMSVAHVSLPISSITNPNYYIMLYLFAQLYLSLSSAVSSQRRQA